MSNWAYASTRRGTVIIMNEDERVLFEDFISTDSLLASAEIAFASAGWTRQGDWEQLASGWQTEVKRT